MTTPEIRFETITPQQARELLATNYEGQRKIRTDWVETIANDIRRHAFHLTGHAIQVDENGKLIDGQHRLLAIIAADMPVTLPIAYGISADAYGSLDQGHKRTMGDFLHHLGVPNYTNMAAALPHLDSYIHTHRFGTRRDTNRIVSHTDLIDTWNREGHLLAKHGAAAVRISKKFHIGSGHVIALLTVAEVSKAAEIDPFVDGLVVGANLDESDPRFQLRTMLLTRAALTPAKRFGVNYYQNLFVRAWNVYARGETTRQLKGPMQGRAVEVFDPYGEIDKRWPLPKNITTEGN